MIIGRLFELERAVSLILTVKDILENQFLGKVVEHEPFTTVAGGMAIADYFGYGSDTP
tara:strand:+ start:152 stop:325 length:174 start_codon:yes stop_codon:yes gene_type:complete